MKPIDPDGFEALYRSHIDPWDYRRSPFEAAKRKVLLKACGPGIYGRGLELGCSIGETTRMLARRCLKLVAIDSSATALQEAARHLGSNPRVALQLAVLPDGMPHGPFDLVVVSEVAYYLRRNDLQCLLARVDRSLAPGGRFVSLHHVRPFDDAAQPPAVAQRAVSAYFARRGERVFLERRNRYEAVAFRKRR